MNKLKARIDAFNRLIVDAKAANVWGSIEAACIMAGWSNVAGALTPLKGAAPTNGGGLFQDSDLDPGIGLKGNASNKWIGTNRLGTADDRDDVHESAYMSAPALAVIGGSSRYIMGATDSGNTNAILQLAGSLNESFQSSPSGSVPISGTAGTAGLRGMSRTSSTALAARSAGVDNSGTVSSVPRSPYQVGVYASAFGVASATSHSDATLSWYSIGSSVDLAALDTVVSQLAADLRAIDEDGFDPLATDYIRRVEAADGAYLETGVKQAINDFIVGCRKDGLLNALKASCIMAGARTISGALVPLVGPAPTAEGAWVSSDYDRATGLKGVPASGTYLNTNRANDADGQDDRHLGVYITESQTINALFIACETSANVAGDSYLFASGAGTSTTAKLSQDGTPVSHYSGGRLTGMYSASRSSSSSVSIRRAGATVSQSVNSVPPISENMFVFNGGGGGFSSDARLAFYSIGSAISDLSLLDNRVTTLISSIAAALS